MVRIERSDSDRRGHRLMTELLVAEPREQVFALFADALRLEELTPRWLHFAVLTPAPIAMKEGTLIDYRLRLHGLPLRWQSRISSWEPPLLFVDEQVQGPYRYWHHRHTFEEVEQGTRICDEVRYAVPFGRILHPLLVRRDLTRSFTFRQQTLSRVLTPVAAQGNVTPT